MKKSRPSLRAGIYLLIIFTVILNAACSEKTGRKGPETGAENLWQADTGLAWPAIALLQTGENPLWFELGEKGPALIESPAAASLTPYAPWPHARFIVGMQLWKGFLVMAVNRDGFIVLGRGRNSEEAVLYRVAGTPLWDPYTAESFFLWEDKPAVLLYRNDFFADFAAPALRPQVFVLDFLNSFPQSARVPALESFPKSSDLWEAEVLRRGPNGLWYYRMKEKGRVDADSAYFSAADLTEPGARISVGEWRNSSRPESPEYIPRHFAAVLGKSAEFGFKEVSAVKIVSPDFEEERVFALSAAAAGVSADEAESPALLFGFCDSSEPLALVISQEGQGLYSTGRKPGVFSFSLPPLPETFAYTGAALLGNVLVASWEEQQEAGVGAAGFMTLAAAKYLEL